MSTSNTSSFMLATQQITIYMGIPTLAAGLLGELLNVIVFLSLKTFRENSCAFYLSVMSFVNIGQLITGLFPQIMINGFDINWTQVSSFYCKFRVYILQLSALTSSTCVCLATIDQFFATCSNPRWQQWNNIKLARILVSIFIFIWIFQGVPYLLYLNLVQIADEPYCTVTNSFFLQYFNYGFVVTLAGFLPVFITILFGLLSYRNIQQSAHRAIPFIRRELDKQLTIMVLVQVVYDSFTTIPYVILYAIMRNPNIANNPSNYPKLQLTSTVLIQLYFLHYATPFYIYVCVSERFRRQLIYVLFEIHLNRWRRRTLPVNQVTP